MISVPTFDCGDGRVRADTAFNRAPVAKTASYTVVAADSGKTFTNRGSAADLTFTLPAPTAGLKLRFHKVVIDKDIVITALTAGTMLGVTGGITVTNATDTEYGSIDLEADGTSWLIVAQVGTWAIS